MLKKRKLSQAEIPTSSMADIAFLLLLFFLVATVIDVDSGIGMTLPEYIPPDEIEQVEVSPDRMVAILINANGDVLVDGEPTSIFQVKEKLKPRISSKIDLPSNKKLIVSLKTDRETNYNRYIQALDQIKMAFFEVRNEYATSRFGSPFDKVVPEEQDIVKDAVPIIISLAEPEGVKE